MPKKSKKRADFLDDGRTVVNMNVEGMPWYHQRQPSPPTKEELPERGGAVKTPAAPDYGIPEKLTGRERRAYVWGVAKAILVIVALFAAVMLVSILIMSRGS